MDSLGWSSPSSSPRPSFRYMYMYVYIYGESCACLLFLRSEHRLSCHDRLRARLSRERAYLAKREGGAHGGCTIAATISAWLMPPQHVAISTGCALKKKRCRKCTCSGRIFLHQRFVELRKTGSKRVDCQPQFAQHANLSLSHSLLHFFGETEYVQSSLPQSRTSLNMHRSIHSHQESFLRHN